MSPSTPQQGRRAAAGPLLLTAADLAAELQLSPRKICAMKSAGQLPPALKFGRSARWRRSDVEAWLAEQLEGAAAV